MEKIIQLTVWHSNVHSKITKRIIVSEVKNNFQIAVKIFISILRRASSFCQMCYHRVSGPRGKFCYVTLIRYIISDTITLTCHQSFFMYSMQYSIFGRRITRMQYLVIAVRQKHSRPLSFNLRIISF